MATTNPTITSAWAKLVAAGDEFTLGIADNQGPAEIALAAMASDEAPAITGQILRVPFGQMNRALTGPGHIYAKRVDGTSVVAWLHSWTPS